MGLFSNKPKKMYTLGEAKRILGQEKYRGYTTVPVETENGILYQIEREAIVAEKARKERLEGTRNTQDRSKTTGRENFVNQLSGNGTYYNLEKPKYIPYSPKQSRKTDDFLR